MNERIDVAEWLTALGFEYVNDRAHEPYWSHPATGARIEEPGLTGIWSAGDLVTKIYFAGKRAGEKQVRVELVKALGLQYQVRV